ncbi:superinfection exclusion B family protein, partial [Lactobacillus delbrueckii]|uniref:superinfection exclusion B family protein n=2 Tax=Lactobacillus delbrueckii TaxID=1584 RepID=UPI001F48F373
CSIYSCNWRTSLALLATNFLPEKYLVRFHLEKFLNDYNPYILIVFFGSLFLIIIHFGSKKRKEKKIRQLRNI